MPGPRLSSLVLAITLALAGLAAAPASAEKLVEIGGVAYAPHPVVGYLRGRPKKILVVPIDWAEVEVKTARAYLAMREAAAADGVVLRVRSGFRTHERQQWLYAAWRAGWGNQAARPGRSNHQSGRALDLDLDQPGALAWLDANGRRFGFRRTVRREPWHWEWNGKQPRKPKQAKRAKQAKQVRSRSGPRGSASRSSSRRR